ncbi:hypothetical protein ACWJKU_15960 [Methylocaldum sp. MU1018]
MVQMHQKKQRGSAPRPSLSPNSRFYRKRSILLFGLCKTFFAPQTAVLIAGSVASRAETVEISFDDLDFSDEIPLAQTARNQAHTFGYFANLIDTHHELPPEIGSNQI